VPLRTGFTVRDPIVAVRTRENLGRHWRPPVSDVINDVQQVPINIVFNRDESFRAGRTGGGGGGSVVGFVRESGAQLKG